MYLCDSAVSDLENGEHPLDKQLKIQGDISIQPFRQTFSSEKRGALAKINC